MRLCFFIGFFIFLICAATPICLPANDLDEFETILKQLQQNKDLMKDAESGGKIAKEFSSKLVRMEELAASIQRTITKLQLGSDFNFVGYSRQVKSAYREASKSNFIVTEQSRSMENRTSFNFAFHQLRQDINELQKMGFTTDNGGSYNRKLQQSKGLMEYQRLLNYFESRFQTASSRDERSPWKDLFDSKITRMKYLANELNRKLAKTNPQLLKKYNFASDTNAAVEIYNKLAGKSSLGTKKSSLSADGDAKSKQRDINEAMFCLKRLKDGINELNTQEFELEDEPGSSDKKKKTPAEEPDEDVKIEDYTNQQLTAKLLALRERVYQKNASMIGINSNVANTYLKTLTKQSQARYKHILKKYTDRDFKGDQAKSSALMELHGLFKAGKLQEPRDEMITVLKKMDKGFDKMMDDLNSKEDEKIQWK